MSGIELQGHLAATGNRMPVLLITAFPKENVRVQAESSGAFGYLGKPFEAGRLVECIGRALSGDGALTQ